MKKLLFVLSAGFLFSGVASAFIVSPTVGNTRAQAVQNCLSQDGVVKSCYQNPNTTWSCNCREQEQGQARRCETTVTSVVGVGIDDARSNCGILGGEILDERKCSFGANGITNVCECCVPK
jgi:hypothetical protein